MSNILERFKNNEGKTYEIYSSINNEKVYFKNRFGIVIVGDIFYSENFDKVLK